MNELYSPPTGASETSLARIQLSLRETAYALGAGDGFKWDKSFYQCGNRLAHAHLLQINRVPTKLVFVYFIGDSTVSGPSTRAEWETAIQTIHNTLGLGHHPPFVVDAFVNVHQFPRPLERIRR